MFDSCFITTLGDANLNNTFNLISDILGYVVLAILAIVILCYFHQIMHGFVGFFCKPKKWNDANKQHKYGYLIPARNESAVIGNLIDSLYGQNYPRELMTVFVIADNCTDDTAEVARKHGAIVFERNDTSKVGKGFALDVMLTKINEMHEYDDIEAFFIFDADNLVSADFTKEMNKVYDSGTKVAMGFRDAKTFDRSWVTAGQTLSFYRESYFLHRPRTKIGMGTFVSGTGFYIAREVLNQYGGWKFNSMIEDIEFSINCAIDKIKIEYCEDAIFYDEQPFTLKDSLNQRLRWCKGSHECSNSNTQLIAKGLSHPSPTSFELSMHIAPLTAIAVIAIISNFVINSIFAAFSLISLDKFLIITYGVISIFVIFVSLLFLIAISCFIVRGKKANIPWYKKVLYCVTFPFFMIFYLPLTVIAIFKKVSWKPITHNDTKSIDNM